MNRTGLIFSCALVSCAIVGAESPGAVERGDFPAGTSTQLSSMRVPDTVDPGASKREAESRYAWLMAEQVLAGVERPYVIELTEGEFAEVELGVCEGCAEEPNRLRVGIAKPAFAKIADRSGVWGASAATTDGGGVWSAAVRSEGAAGIRLHFGGFRLPSNSELYLFNDDGDVAGPYVGDGPLGTGDFWSNMISGDTVYLQLRRYGPPASKESLKEASTVLLGVGHVGSRFSSTIEGAKSFCDYNAGCIVNVSCAGDPPAVEVARDAVAHMLFVEEPYLYACSGGLINNTAEDGTPYFLTANHCLNTDVVAATLEAFFKWSVECGATCPEQWGTPIDAVPVLGAVVVETNRVGDYTLLRLDGETAPPGTALLGWTSVPVAYSDETPLYRVSHPAGAPQAYSEHRVDVDARTCLFWPRGASIYSRDVVGATEGGSSGSPVVNANGQVVGQLSGACGLLAWLPCLSGWHATVDGALAGYFAEVAPWLAPSGGCNDDLDGDGFIAVECGGDDCNDDEFFINPGVAEVCDNGVDDNCNLAVDDEDPECAICLPEGAACTRSADCCSKWCRWFGRTCR